MSVFRKSVSAIALVAAISSESAAQSVPEVEIPAIEGVIGESYILRMDAAAGNFYIPQLDKTVAARAFLFDLFKAEEIECATASEFDFNVTWYMYDPEHKKAVDGWRHIQSNAPSARPIDKPYRCGTTVGLNNSVFKPGRYKAIVSTADGVDRDIRIVFFNPNAPLNKDEKTAALTGGRPIDWHVEPNGPALAVGPPPVIGDYSGLLLPGTRDPRLRPFIEALLGDGEYNAVANLAKLGQAAIEVGDYPLAERAFDGALDRIEAIYADNDIARAARSTFTAEAVKDFKGDPYERAMTYYYRGLLYLRAGDYDNARASFAMAEYQDTLSDAEEYRSDFALMNYLAGWSARCAGNVGLADDAFARAAALNPRLIAPAAEQTVLAIAEEGMGPVKYRRGARAQMVAYAHSVDYVPVTATPPSSGGASMVRAADLSYQAMTRGGRQFDVIMQGKANFKAGADNIGTMLAQGGNGLVSAGMGAAGAVGAAFALVALASGSKSQSDIRYWDTVPDGVFLKALSPQLVKVTFAKSPAPAATMSGEPNQACGLAWSRRESMLDRPAGVRGTPGRGAAAKRIGASPKADLVTIVAG